MPRRRRMPWLLTVVAGLLVGCTSQVPGESGTPEGTAGTALPALATTVWQRIPASDDTRRLLVMLDAPVLTAIAARSDFPDDGTSSLDDRPSSETAYTEYVPVPDQCSALDSSGRSARTGAAGIGVSVRSSSDPESNAGSLAICGGAATPSLIQKFLGDGTAQRTVAGVAGYIKDTTFIGVDPALSATVFQQGTPDPAVVSAALTGAPADGSVLADADVQQVLAVSSGAAALAMGTDLLGQDRSGAPSAVTKALERAVARGGFGEPPTPEFGGFAWIPGPRVSGTTVFVTVYGSDAEANNELQILNHIWSDVGASKFSGAQTVQNGSVVVTSIPDTHVKDFRVVSSGIAEYPGFLGRT